MTVKVLGSVTVLITDDRPLVLAFLDWLCEPQQRGVNTLKGTGNGSGPDWYWGTFPVSTGPALSAFFQAQRIIARMDAERAAKAEAKP